MKRGEIAHDISRGAFWLALDKLVVVVVGTLYLALMLRWMGPTKLGIITLAFAFAGFAAIATGNLEMWFERYAAEHEMRGTLRTLRRGYLLAMATKLGLGLAAGVALVLAAPWLSATYGMPELREVLPLLSLTVVFDGPFTVGRATLYGLRQYRRIALLSVPFQIVRVIAVALLWRFERGLFELVVLHTVLAVGQGIATALVPAWMMRRVTDPPGSYDVGAATQLRGMLRYCLPLLGARATFMSGQNLGKIVLGKLFTATELGYFSFAFQTVERFVELVHTLPSALLPVFTRLVTHGERARLRHVFDQSHRLVQVVACALSFVLFVFAHEITVLVAGRLFEPAAPLLRILALVPVVRTSQQPLTMLFQAMRRPEVVLGLALVKFAAEFGCYFLLVGSLGPAGAGWANLAGAIASYVCALAVLGGLLPEGGDARVRAFSRSLALLVPLLLLALVVEGALPWAQSLAARLGLAVVAVVGVFALGLVNRYDLDQLSSIPLRAAWLRRVRDGLVAAVQRFARPLERRSSP